MKQRIYDDDKDRLSSLVEFLSYTNGRDKALMLIQYSAVLLSTSNTRISSLESAMSDARKGLRYFRMFEEIKKLREVFQQFNKERRTTTTDYHQDIITNIITNTSSLKLSSHVVNICYYALDHVEWMAHLSLINIKNSYHRKFKIYKNMISFIRIILDIMLHTQAFVAERKKASLRKLKHSCEDVKAENVLPFVDCFTLLSACSTDGKILLERYGQSFMNLVLSIHGMKMRRFNKSILGICGLISALLSIRNFKARLLRERLNNTK